MHECLLKEYQNTELDNMSYTNLLFQNKELSVSMRYLRQIYNCCKLPCIIIDITEIYET